MLDHNKLKEYKIVNIFNLTIIYPNIRHSIKLNGTRCPEFGTKLRWPNSTSRNRR